MRMDELENKIFIGELGLDGKIRPVNARLYWECGQKAGIKGSCAEGKCEGSCLSAGDSCLRDENVKRNCGTVK
ncbi:MAG: hypothetical protein ACLRZ6_00440 [Lachnospiraceae bacterium]